MFYLFMSFKINILQNQRNLFQEYICISYIGCMSPVCFKHAKLVYLIIYVYEQLGTDREKSYNMFFYVHEKSGFFQILHNKKLLKNAECYYLSCGSFRFFTYKNYTYSPNPLNFMVVPFLQHVRTKLKFKYKGSYIIIKTQISNLMRTTCFCNNHYCPRYWIDISFD